MEDGQESEAPRLVLKDQDSHADSADQAKEGNVDSAADKTGASSHDQDQTVNLQPSSESVTVSEDLSPDKDQEECPQARESNLIVFQLENDSTGLVAVAQKFENETGSFPSPEVSACAESGDKRAISQALSQIGKILGCNKSHLAERRELKSKIKKQKRQIRRLREKMQESESIKDTIYVGMQHLKKAVEAFKML